MRRKLAAVAMVVAACAGPTKLTAVQVAPENPREKFRNLLVVALVRDPASRQAYEVEMVKALQGAGVQAAASGALLPIGEVPTRAALERLVAERGFDGAVLGRLVDSRTEVRAVPPPDPMYVGFYGYSGWAAPIAYAPGYLETTRTVVVETRVFRTAGEGTPVFSATSDTMDPSSAKELSASLAPLVVGQLRKDGFI